VAEVVAHEPAAIEVRVREVIVCFRDDLAPVVPVRLFEVNRDDPLALGTEIGQDIETPAEVGDHERF